MERNRLTKRERLSGRKAVARLFEQGRGEFVYPFRYICLAGEETAAVPVSVLVSVSKRNHKRAVVRNLLKRRTREAYRTQKHALASLAAEKGVCVQIAFVYSSKEVEDFNTIRDAVGKILGKISERL